MFCLSVPHPTGEQAARFVALEEAIDACQRELSEAKEVEDDERNNQAESAISDLQDELEALRDSLLVLPEDAMSAGLATLLVPPPHSSAAKTGGDPHG